MKKIWISLLLLLLLFPIERVSGQEDNPTAGPYYTVQSGDNLWAIASRFGVSVDALAQQNNLSDPSQLTIGLKLVIPGLEGLQGELITGTVPFGENLQSLARRFQIPVDLISRLNHYTSPNQVYAGSRLILPDQGGDGLEPLGGRVTLGVGQSLLELAISHNATPWSLMAVNEIQESWSVLPHDVLHLIGINDSGPGTLPPQINTLELETLPLLQGQTAVVKLSGNDVISLQGALMDYPLNFFQQSGGNWVALQGIHALAEPGLYPLALSGTLADGEPLDFVQQVYIGEAGYPYDPPLVVDSETIDVNNTSPEDLQWAAVVEPITTEKMWDGTFLFPVDEYWSDCFTSWFGNRRSYNGSAYQYFHTGLDFCNNPDFGLNNVYAPADGVVVFTGELVVHGNATVIDHGWGIYTAYGHQSEIKVAEGDHVEAGQVIGIVGQTGRVSGPHLHWEIVVGGVQVDPLQWLERTFP